MGLARPASTTTRPSRGSWPRCWPPSPSIRGSVQHSIWILGKAILEAEPTIDVDRFALPNLHHWMADLSPFGIDNDRQIFVSTTDPHGLIEATVRRSA